MTTNSSPIFPLVARSLQLVGLVAIVSFLLDATTLLYPPNLANVQWRLGYTSQIVDRGVVPLVGLAFFLVGIWVNSSSESSNSGQTQNLLKTGSVVLASILGVAFLFVAPLHAVDTIRNRDLALGNIEQQASRAEDRLETPQFRENLERQRDRFVTQIQELISNEERLNEQIESGQLPEQQINLLEQFKNNPGAIEEFADRQVSQLRSRTLRQIRERKLQAQRQVRQTAVRSISRAFSSGLLAIAYIGIGWMGLTGGASGARRPRKRLGKR